MTARVAIVNLFQTVNFLFQVLQESSCMGAFLQRSYAAAWVVPLGSISLAMVFSEMLFIILYHKFRCVSMFGKTG
jgi:hypothetical protein